MIDPWETATEGIPRVQYPEGDWIFGRSGNLSLQIEVNPFSLALLGLWRYGRQTGPTGRSTSGGALKLPWANRAGGYKISFVLTYKQQVWSRTFLFTRWLPVKVIGKLMAKYKKKPRVKGVRII